MREKLINLLYDAMFFEGYGRELREEQADYLIANGVTLDNQVSSSKWISVKDRLPELHTKVLCCGIKGGRFIAELGTWGHEKDLYWDKKNGQGSPTVTHWMPLPEPPEGEWLCISHQLN